MSRRIMKGLGTWGLGLGLMLMIGSPAVAQSRREMQMMADIRMLQEQTQQLQQQLQASLDQLAGTLKAISSRVDDQAATMRKSFADQKLAVDQFGTDLRIVRERIDENTVRINNLAQEVEALRLAIPQFPTTPPIPADPGAAPATAIPGTTPEAPPVALAPGMTPQRLYSSAQSDFSIGQWALCIEGFNMYLRNFPRMDNADDAQWYVGECYYHDGKRIEAIDAYNRVISNYPKGDRVPDAYYKRGITFSELGQIDRAVESLDTLMKTFPEHDMARLAKQQLDRLKMKK